MLMHHSVYTLFIEFGPCIPKFHCVAFPPPAQPNADIAAGIFSLQAFVHEDEVPPTTNGILVQVGAGELLVCHLRG